MNSLRPDGHADFDPVVVREIDGCVAAHGRLLATIDGLSDAVAHGPSLLPGWTVGHVLTHLARNADGFVHMIDGAERGEVVSQYPSPEARTADIEAGSGRPAEELVADVIATAARLEERWRTTSATGWAGSGRTIMGPSAIVELPGRRRREVEVHHADLGLGFTPQDWSTEYVRQELVRMQMLWASRRPMGMTALPDAALAVAPHQRLAWLLGRATIDGLEPAGIY